MAEKTLLKQMSASCRLEASRGGDRQLVRLSRVMGIADGGLVYYNRLLGCRSKNHINASFEYGFPHYLITFLNILLTFKSDLFVSVLLELDCRSQFLALIT